MLTDDMVQMLVRNPLLMLQYSFEHKIEEEDWKQVYEWLLKHRMTDELHVAWLRNQLTHGIYRYRAIGQLFARYATIGKGWSTVDNASRVKLGHKKSNNNNINNNNK